MDTYMTREAAAAYLRSKCKGKAVFIMGSTLVRRNSLQVPRSFAVRVTKRVAGDYLWSALPMDGKGYIRVTENGDSVFFGSPV